MNRPDEAQGRDRHKADILWAFAQLFGPAADFGFKVRAVCQATGDEIAYRCKIGSAQTLKPREGRTGQGKTVLETGPLPVMNVSQETMLSLLFSEEEIQVIEALGTHELSTEALAKKCGHTGEAPARFRSMLTNLGNRNVLEPTRNGFRIKSPEILILVGLAKKYRQPTSST